MPLRCCVPLCKGNYDNGPKVHIFSFPKEEKLANTWLRAIRRNDFTATSQSKVCHLHFQPKDIMWETSQFNEETGVTLSAKLKVPRLRTGAVPTKLPNAPSYLSSNGFSRESPDARRKRKKEEEIKVAIKRQKHGDVVHQQENRCEEWVKKTGRADLTRKSSTHLNTTHRLSTEDFEDPDEPQTITSPGTQATGLPSQPSTTSDRGPAPQTPRTDAPSLATPALTKSTTSGVQKAQKKKVSIPKRPKHPIKPPTPYMAFSEKADPKLWGEVSAENKMEKIYKIVNIVHEMWTELPEAEKKMYEDEYVIKKAEYDKQLEAYQEYMGVRKVKVSVKKPSSSAKHKQNKGTGKKENVAQERQKNRHVPKKPAPFCRSLSPYLIYHRKMRDQLKASDTRLTMQEIHNRILSSWCALSTDDRKPYLDEYETQKAEFQKAQEAERSSANQQVSSSNGDVTLMDDTNTSLTAPCESTINPQLVPAGETNTGVLPSPPSHMPPTPGPSGLSTPQPLPGVESSINSLTSPVSMSGPLPTVTASSAPPAVPAVLQERSNKHRRTEDEAVDPLSHQTSHSNQIVEVPREQNTLSDRNINSITKVIQSGHQKREQLFRIQQEQQDVWLKMQQQNFRQMVQLQQQITVMLRTQLRQQTSLQQLVRQLSSTALQVHQGSIRGRQEPQQYRRRLKKILPAPPRAGAE